jgi:hypothetical protein
VLPLLGEDVPPEAVGRLITAVDVDRGGTIDGAEVRARQASWQGTRRARRSRQRQHRAC